jgi:hypothetical protein
MCILVRKLPMAENHICETFHEALENSNNEYIITLLEYGADVNKKTNG